MPQLPASSSLTLRGQVFDWGQRTYLMGVLNVTPDSFSDGGLFNQLDAAVAQANYMAESGVDILDIGGQSTRPQAADLPLQTELDRVLPVIQALRRELPDLPISIDTTKAEVARAAVAAGADLVNDISGATFDPAMLATVAELQVPIVLMHIRGTPQTMQSLTDYADLIGEICEFLAGRAAAALQAGITPERIWLDPGIGFGKTLAHNLALTADLDRLVELGFPVLFGASRKRMILGIDPTATDPGDRIGGSVALALAAAGQGARMIRVHSKINALVPQSN